MIGSRYSMFFAAGMAAGANALVDNVPVIGDIAISVPEWINFSLAGAAGVTLFTGGVVLCYWLAKKSAQEQQDLDQSLDSSNPSYYSI